ncbi:hypothetical protein pb186bvf_009895 [Paramecium bursaria]
MPQKSIIIRKFSIVNKEILCLSILKFDNIRYLPKNFFCKICYDVCRQPILEDRYNQQEIESCNDEVKVIFNYLSSYLQFLITYDCEYCGKNIDYWNSGNHQMKCKDIVVTLTDMMAHFELITSQEVEKCLNCNQIPFKPKQHQGRVVCMFCQHKNSFDNLVELSEEQLNIFNNYQIRCKQCSEILNLQQTFLHFKKCLFNDNNYDINSFQNYQQVKQLRKYQKDNDKLFNINWRKHLKGQQNEKKINLQIIQTKVQQKRIAKELNYLKSLVDQHEN